jgi:hypothetical protein
MTPESLGNVLMLYLEPTPYVLGLIHRLRQGSGDRLVVYYLARNLSQSWGLEANGEDTLLSRFSGGAFAQVVFGWCIWRAGDILSCW